MSGATELSGGARRRFETVVLGRAAARRTMRALHARGTVTAPPTAFPALMRALSGDCTSVIDVGTGLMRSLTLVSCPVKVGVDAHRPYLERREVEDAVPINAPAADLERLFVPGAADLVTLIDVIEHFERADADDLLRRCERIARRRVVLFTPRGEFPQEDDEYGLGGEELQRHRSSWEPEDLVARGYRVAVLRGFHHAGNPSFVKAFGAGAPPQDALLAWNR